jgi:hypothetical protein
MLWDEQWGQYSNEGGGLGVVGSNAERLAAEPDRKMFTLDTLAVTEVDL